MALHFVLYAGVLFYVLPVWQAVAFIAVHQAVFGFYMGSVFAPNHKGMPIIDKDSNVDFLRRQVLTSRDVRGHVVTDFIYGGLNYQIWLQPPVPQHAAQQAQAGPGHCAGLLRRARHPLPRAARCSRTRKSCSTSTK